MTLLGLPNEVLKLIIDDVLPEGFESLSLACRRLNALCKPSLNHHKELKRRFRTFMYAGDRYNLGRSKDHESGPASAIELIAQIAIEPVVARYIEYAYFDKDGEPSFPDRRIRPWTDCAGASLVPQLFATSPYLRAAGIDWKDYFDKMDEELGESFFSPRAAAFLLTLLPNVKVLHLPWTWRTRIEHTEKLVNSIVDRLKKPYYFWRDQPSLANVRKLDALKTPAIAGPVYTSDSPPFATLPRLRTLRYNNHLGLGARCFEGPSKEPTDVTYGKGLETVKLHFCAMDEAGVTTLLRSTPRLRKLSYKHIPNVLSRDNKVVNVCAFANAVSRQAGSHLQVLSVTHTSYFVQPVATPVRAYLRGFTRLRRLELDLDFVYQSMSAIRAPAAGIAVAFGSLTLASSSFSGSPPMHEPSASLSSSLLSDIVPASTQYLLLRSQGQDHHAEALQALFYDFATTKRQHAPLLKEIRLFRPYRQVSSAYKKQCRWLIHETRKADVCLITHNSSPPYFSPDE